MQDLGQYTTQRKPCCVLHYLLTMILSFTFYHQSTVGAKEVHTPTQLSQRATEGSRDCPVCGSLGVFHSVFCTHSLGSAYLLYHFSTLWVLFPCLHNSTLEHPHDILLSRFLASQLTPLCW